MNIKTESENESIKSHNTNYLIARNTPLLILI